MKGRIKVYDKEGRSLDRYTVVFLECPGSRPGLYVCLAMSGDPFWPQGFCQHSEALIGSHLGKPIAFEELPADCQKATLQDLAHIDEWLVKETAY